MSLYVATITDWYNFSEYILRCKSELTTEASSELIGPVPWQSVVIQFHPSGITATSRVIWINLVWAIGPSWTRRGIWFGSRREKTTRGKTWRTKWTNFSINTRRRDKGIWCHAREWKERKERKERERERERERETAGHARTHARTHARGRNGTHTNA